MNLKQELNLKQIQSLKLTPQLQLAIQILQANSLELNQMIEQELLENPILESVNQDTEENQNENLDENELLTYVKDFEKYFSESQDTYTPTEINFAEKPALEEYVSNKEDLKDWLLKQYALSAQNEIEEKIGTYLIDSLDKDGYLKEPVSKIAASLMVSENLVEKALVLLQSLDPVGVGARNLKECLLIQYYAKDLKDPLVRQIIENHLEDLADNKIPEIKESLGVEFLDIEKAVSQIKQLNPRPVQGYINDSILVENIVPDLFVKLVNDEVIVTLNDKNYPQLSISNYYQNQLRNAESLSKEELNYLKQKLDAALWFKQSIEKRNETILLVAKNIFLIQKDFLNMGLAGLKPLTLADIASKVDRHEATISRVVNGKYAQTEAGLFELKFFFSGGLKSDDGDFVSTKHIREIILQAINEEDPKRPISDQMLAKLLNARGIEIARRTVSKYREMLDIPSSTKRKKFI